MTTTVADQIFVDTNVLIFAHLGSSAFHRVALQRLHEAEASGATLYISRQVIREFLAVMTRPPNAAQISRADVLTDVRHLSRRFAMLEDGPRVTARLLDLAEQYMVSGRPVHDANIVATMLAHDVRRLLTHNVGDFARFASLIDVSPLT